MTVERMISRVAAFYKTDLRTVQKKLASLTRKKPIAKALDRFQPPNLNLASGGGSWVRTRDGGLEAAASPAAPAPPPAPADPAGEKED